MGQCKNSARSYNKLIQRILKRTLPTKEARPRPPLDRKSRHSSTPQVLANTSHQLSPRAPARPRTVSANHPTNFIGTSTERALEPVLQTIIRLNCSSNPPIQHDILRAHRGLLVENEFPVGPNGSSCDPRTHCLCTARVAGSTAERVDSEQPRCLQLDWIKGENTVRRPQSSRGPVGGRFQGARERGLLDATSSRRRSRAWRSRSGTGSAGCR